ncbi:MAG TPA: hypothetical protein V6D17_25155 [Candidatus Obscuribacterales bacterium]
MKLQTNGTRLKALLTGALFACSALIGALTIGEAAAKADAPSAVSTNWQQIVNDFHHLRQTLRRLRGLAGDLLGEFNRTQLQILEYEDYLAKYVDGTEKYSEQLYPYGFQNIGNTDVQQGPPLPPRRKWVDHYMDQLQDIVAFVRTDTKDAISLLPQSVSDQLKDRINTLTSQAGEICESYDELRTFTKADMYDNSQIKAKSRALADDAQLLDQSIRQLLRDLKPYFRNK